MKNENIKCGRIYRSPKGMFIFTCTHCNESFYSTKKILDHIDQHFILPNTRIPEAETPMQTEITVYEENGKFETIYSENDRQNDCLNSNFDHLIEEIGDDEEEILADDRNNVEGVDCTMDDSNEKVLPSLNTANELRIRKVFSELPVQQSKNTTIECPICQKNIKISYIRDHLELHQNITYTCDICQKTFGMKKYLKNHMRTHGSNYVHRRQRLQCESCGATFHERRSLVKHRYTHSDVRPHICEYCGKGFKDNQTLSHHKDIHTSDYSFICVTCDKAHCSQSRLNQHIRRKHLKIHRIKCDLCDQLFIDTHTMRDHRVTHTGEKPYKCDLCEKCYAQKSNLRIHKKKFHTSGTLPYICQQCSAAFDAYSLLRTHQKRTHIKSKCRVCGDLFETYKERRAHERHSHAR